MYVSRCLLLGVTLYLVVPMGVALAENGRYTMSPTKEGALRLDTETGEMALCENRSEKQWSCTPIEDKSAGLKRRIEELERENAELKARLGAFGPSQQAVPGPQGKLDLPSEQDVDKAMDFVERMLKRFKGIIEDLRKQEQDGKGVPL